MKITKCLALFACGALLTTAGSATTQDAYYHLALSSLTLTEGTLPAPSRNWGGRRWPLLPAMQPYAVLDGAGEVFVTGASETPWMPPDRSPQTAAIAIRAPEGSEITGRLFMPQTNLNGMVALKFKVTPAEAAPGARAEFFTAKEDHYRQLQDGNIPDDLAEPRLQGSAVREEHRQIPRGAGRLPEPSAIAGLEQPADP